MADDITTEGVHTPKPSETLRIFVSGRVQGVGYRAWLHGEAVKRGLFGWVRNRHDGTVEAVVHGDAAAVDDLVRACRHGPSLARVDKVHTEIAEYDGLETFRVEQTA